MQVTAQVTRGAMSMSFFAFIFSALFAYFLVVFNDYSGYGWLKKPWVRSVIKTVVFCGLFVLVMKNAWFHNRLSDLLGWLQTEKY